MDNLIEDNIKQLSSKTNENIDVLELLNRTGEGKKIINSLNNNKFLSKSERCSLVKLTVDELIYINSNAYPTTDQKTNLAKSIIEAFPCLGSKTLGCSTHSAFFDSQGGSMNTPSGFIEYRLKTVRSSLPSSQKKNKKKSKPIDIIPLQKTDEIGIVSNAVTSCTIAEINQILPTNSNKKEIFEKMQNIFEYRRNFILDTNNTITTIFEEFSHLQHYNGEIIINDFNVLYNEINFEDRYKKCIPIIMELDKKLNLKK